LTALGAQGNVKGVRCSSSLLVALVGFFLLAAFPARGEPRLIQTKTVIGSGTSTSLTLDEAPRPGSTLLVVAGCYSFSAHVFGISDTVGNAFTPIQFTNFNATATQSWIVDAPVAAAAPITVTTLNPSSTITVGVLEYGGLAAQALEDFASAVSSSTTTVTSPTKTLSGPGMFFGYAWDQTSFGAFPVWTVTSTGGAPTKRLVFGSSSDGETMVVADIIPVQVSTPTSANFTFSRSDGQTSGALHSGIVLLRAGVAADGGAPDAGGPDAGGADAGELHAGVEDAGEADAGVADGGHADAGSPAAAAPDAGSSDAGCIVEAGLPDAECFGAGAVPRRLYFVGCGCSESPAALGASALVFLSTLRRRRAGNSVIAHSR
jgi:hypothetical protein